MPVTSPPDFSPVVSPGLPRSDDTPGTELELLVLSVDRDHWPASTWRRAPWSGPGRPAPVDGRLRPYDVVAGTLDDDPDGVPDPSRARGPRPDRAARAGSGAWPAAGCERYYGPLLHPQRPAVARRPRPRRPLLGAQRRTIPRSPWSSRRAPQSWPPGRRLWLPVRVAGHDHASCRASTRASGRGMARSGRRAWPTGKGDRLLVALTPPIDGRCHKVVEACCPRP